MTVVILFFNKTIKNRFIACEPSGSQAKAQHAFEEVVQYQSWAKHRLCPAQQTMRIKRLFSSVLLKIGITIIEITRFGKPKRKTHPAPRKIYSGAQGDCRLDQSENL